MFTSGPCLKSRWCFLALPFWQICWPKFSCEQSEAELAPGERGPFNEMRIENTNFHSWRKLKSALASAIAFCSAILVIAPLALVFWHLLRNGASAINLDFFTKLPKPVGEIGGGMVNAIVGSLELLGLASVVGIPIGVLGG